MVLGQLVNALNNLSGEDVRNIFFVVALAVVAVITMKHMGNSEGLGSMMDQDELDHALQNQVAESMAAAGDGPMGVGANADGMDISGLIQDDRHLPQFADTTLNAEDLLPAQNDERFNELHPRGGAGKLSGGNFLASKAHFGVDTQGTSLRNANLQLRSELANPVIDNLTPFNMSTIDDTGVMRKGMEIGSAPSQSIELPAF